MTQTILLDTCACIWIVENAPLAGPAVAALDAAFDEGRDTFVSPITAWEVGMLTARGRLALNGRPIDWFSALLAIHKFAVAPLEAGPLIDASFLPGLPPNDPADRILVATARRNGWTLMTRDRLLVDYAAQGHLRLIAC